jgi:hypothetical protein
MTFFGMALLTAIGTIVLAVFAVFTAWYARKAFREQSREVAAIEQQVKDEQEVTRQQGELLKVQSDQLELQRRQFERDQAARRRAQAAQVFIMIGRVENVSGQITVMSNAHNTSQLPVYDLWVQWRSSLGEFGTAAVVPQFSPGDIRPFPGVWTQGTRPSGFDVSLDFRDAAGVRWRTTSRGILTELCGAVSPSLAREHCTFAPEHDGPHSWEEAGSG